MKGLTLGFVNEEVSSMSDCTNHSLITAKVEGFDCALNKVSCRFIFEINDDIAYKRFFNSYEEAFTTAKRGEILGFVYFSRNFTQALKYFNDDAQEDLTEDGIVQVYLEETDLQKSTFMKRMLHEAYERFIERLMVDCGKSKRAGSSPIIFKAEYGELDFSFRLTTATGYLMT